MSWCLGAALSTWWTQLQTSKPWQKSNSGHGGSLLVNWYSRNPLTRLFKESLVFELSCYHISWDLQLYSCINNLSRGPLGLDKILFYWEFVTGKIHESSSKGSSNSKVCIRQILTRFTRNSRSARRHYQNMRQTDTDFEVLWKELPDYKCESRVAEDS